MTLEGGAQKEVWEEDGGMARNLQKRRNIQCEKNELCECVPLMPSLLCACVVA